VGRATLKARGDSLVGQGGSDDDGWEGSSYVKDPRMHRRRRFLLVAVSASFTGCTGSRPPLPTSSVMTPAAVLIPAAPGKGFQFPYLLRVPPAGEAQLPFLVVEPNNSGHVSPDRDEHVGAAMALARQGVGGDVARRLSAPFLIPVFPRSPALYTHSLNRQTLLTTDPQLHRIDLQLLAMIRDARERLAERGVPVLDKALLVGFSASGMFVTRFTALHPDAVQALAVGGINGFVILPMERLDGTLLPFPLGVSDLPRVVNRPFDADAWRRIPQFIFMGAVDANDAVPNDDAYPEGERAVIYALLGAKMLPDRWERLQALYRRLGVSATFTTYAGLGHGTNGRIHEEIARFFRRSSLG
jgi:pimeloyl-ACP methyl ester carboxylesterase